MWMWTLLCPLESKILHVGPQLWRFAGVFIYKHLPLRTREHCKNSSLSFSCCSIFDFNYKLKIYARQDFPFFKLVPTFEQDHLSKKMPSVTPYHLGCTTTTLNGVKCSKFVNEKGEISQFSNLSR